MLIKLKYSCTFLGWLMLWLILGTLFTLITVGIASAQTSKEWMWFENPWSSPGIERSADIGIARSHASSTMSVDPFEPADWTAAQAAGLKVMTSLPDDIFWAVRDTDPQIPALTTLMWCRVPNFCGKTIQDWVDLMNAHRGEISGIRLTDELDCNTDDGLHPYPNWPVEACQRAARKLETLNTAVKQWLPWIRTWSNMTAAMAFWAQLGRHVAVYGVSYPPTDVVSLDCYTPFLSCFGNGMSVQRLYEGIKPYLRADQRFFLMPRAFMGYDPTTGWNPTVADLDSMRLSYEQYANYDPRIAGIVPFILGHENGAKRTPSLLACFTNWALRVRGIPPSPPAAVTGVRIIRTW